MQRWQQRYLGLAGFPPTMSSAEIDQFFTFSRRELTVIMRRRGPLNRLSVGLQIGFLRMAGRTLNSFQILPVAVLKHLDAQLRLAPPRLASIRALYRRQRTLFDHQRVAMEVLGFRHLTDHYAADGRSLPKGATNPFPKVWSPLIECAATPEVALGAFEAATLMMLKRSLRNGSASTRQSLTYRGQEDILIPAAVWDREQDRLTGELGLPASIDALVTGLHDTLQASLRSLASAVAEGVVFVERTGCASPA